MKIIESELVVFYDVDDTLVMHGLEPSEKDLYITGNVVAPNEAHIKLMRSQHSRGYTIIVWSAGGYEWAAEVVHALGLQSYVSYIMSKPLCYVDDLPVEKFMTQRVYLTGQK